MLIHNHPTILSLNRRLSAAVMAASHDPLAYRQALVTLQEEAAVEEKAMSLQLQREQMDPAQIRPEDIETFASLEIATLYLASLDENSTSAADKRLNCALDNQTDENNRPLFSAFLREQVAKARAALAAPPRHPPPPPPPPPALNFR